MPILKRDQVAAIVQRILFVVGGGLVLISGLVVVFQLINLHPLGNRFLIDAAAGLSLFLGWLLLVGARKWSGRGNENQNHEKSEVSRTE